MKAIEKLKKKTCIQRKLRMKENILMSNSINIKEY